MNYIVCWRWKATKKSDSAAFVCIALSIYPHWLSDGVTPEDTEKLNNNNGELKIAQMPETKIQITLPVNLQ